MKKVIIYTDGASRGNPGEGGVGVVFCNEKGGILKKYSEYLGDKVTNNQAEYKAVIMALKKFKALFGKELAKKTDIEIRSDSELLVNQLNGKYKLNNPGIQDFFIEIWNLKIDFNSVKFKKIPREKNAEADKLANIAIDEENKATLFG